MSDTSQWILEQFGLPIYTGMMLIFLLSEIEPRASLVLGKCSTTELYLFFSPWQKKKKT